MRMLILAAVATATVCFPHPATAGGGQPFKPSAVATNSDVIVIAEVQSVTNLNSAFFSNPSLQIEIIVRAKLKGDPKKTKVVVSHTYEYKSSPMTLNKGDTGVMFLKWKDGKLVLTAHGAFGRFTPGFFYE